MIIEKWVVFKLNGPTCVTPINRNFIFFFIGSLFTYMGGSGSLYRLHRKNV
ncbi:hypothetical protein HanIR_Chr05g0216341 [Helianthus annuus]|nr:hypothetical protein HanIR_Chr05g0216341 [Helianthus annuus]